MEDDTVCTVVTVQYEVEKRYLVTPLPRNLHHKSNIQLPPHVKAEQARPRRRASFATGQARLGSGSGNAATDRKDHGLAEGRVRVKPMKPVKPKMLRTIPRWTTVHLQGAMYSTVKPLITLRRFPTKSRYYCLLPPRIPRRESDWQIPTARKSERNSRYRELDDAIGRCRRNTTCQGCQGCVPRPGEDTGGTPSKQGDRAGWAGLGLNCLLLQCRLPHSQHLE